MQHIYGRNCAFALYIVQIDAAIYKSSPNAKWPLQAERPFAVQTTQVLVSLADGRELEAGAESRTRTDDLLITNQLLYQLSYFGLPFKLCRCARIR